MREKLTKMDSVEARNYLHKLHYQDSISVDEAISGVGYCGLPKLPVRVEVLSHPKAWRIISGVAALIGWGGSGYLILRNQQ